MTMVLEPPRVETEAVRVVVANDRGGTCDVLVLDINMPGRSGLPGLLYLRSQNPDVPIAVVSSMTEPAIMRRAVEVGAAGFIPRDADAPLLREAIRGMLDGEIWVPPDLDFAVPPDACAAVTLRRLSSLTPQQLRVLTMLAQGLLNKQIAYELSVSEATVKAHVSAILQKLDVEGRVQAVAAVRLIEGDCFTRSPAGR